ncbi:MAG: hypothetical protein ACREOO_30350 [bacterium]
MSFYFSDMLSNHQLSVAVSANCGLKDLGAQAFYQNLKRRWNWGVMAGHFASRSSQTLSGPTEITINDQLVPALMTAEFRQRTFYDQAMLTTAYPFSTTRRVQANTGYTHIDFGW